jgi:hypothetical protein
VINDSRAMELYRMAVSVVESKGQHITIGLTTLREYRYGNLIIHYRPSTGHIDVWFRRKVFSINRFKDGLRVAHFTQGASESELELAAGKPLPN